MTLHQKHPDTPIIVIQTLIRETGNFNRKARENVKRQNEAIAEQVEVLRKEECQEPVFHKKKINSWEQTMRDCRWDPSE